MVIRIRLKNRCKCQPIFKKVRGIYRERIRRTNQCVMVFSSYFYNRTKLSTDTKGRTTFVRFVESTYKWMAFLLSGPSVFMLICLSNRCFLFTYY